MMDYLLTYHQGNSVRTVLDKGDAAGMWIFINVPGSTATREVYTVY